MSYNQVIKHSKNHRKDKFYQQCGFSWSDSGIKSGGGLLKDYIGKYEVRNIKTDESIRRDFKTADEAVEFLLGLNNNYLYGVYTDYGYCVMK